MSVFYQWCHYSFSGIGNCLLYIDKSIPILRHLKKSVWHERCLLVGSHTGKCLIVHFLTKNQGDLSHLNMCVFHLWVFSYRGVIHSSPCLVDGNRRHLISSPKPILPVFHLLLTKLYSLLLRVLVFTYCRMDFVRETSRQLFSKMV